ncbi:hypothetical protein ACFGVR_11640 [Mucilaginibacter sp. AW1-3]
MKKHICFVLVSLLFVVSLSAFGQKISALDQSADEVCAGLQGFDPAKASAEEVQKAFETLIVKSFSAHMNDLMKEMNMTEINADNGRKIGEEIGKKLLVRCPKFITLATKFDSKDSGDTDVSTTTGTLTKVNDTGDFAQFILKDADGRETNYYWLRYFKGSENFEKGGAANVGKKVKIQWAEIEFYVPKAKGYYKLKEVKAVDFL